MANRTAYLRWRACKSELVNLKAIYETTTPILTLVLPSWRIWDGTLDPHNGSVKHVAESIDMLMEHENMIQTMYELASLISDQEFSSSDSEDRLVRMRAELQSIKTESSSYSTIEFIRRDEEAEIIRRHLETEAKIVKRLIADVSLSVTTRFGM